MPAFISKLLSWLLVSARLQKPSARTRNNGGFGFVGLKIFTEHQRRLSLYRPNIISPVKSRKIPLTHSIKRPTVGCKLFEPMWVLLIDSLFPLIWR
ncbi:MAG: hypothetical protein M3Z92_04490 [Bacteroidota bacterium]|nr:hypothetical protein [Bacteroidota bacterium]